MNEDKRVNTSQNDVKCVLNKYYVCNRQENIQVVCTFHYKHLTRTDTLSYIYFNKT